MAIIKRINLPGQSQKFCKGDTFQELYDDAQRKFGVVGAFKLLTKCGTEIADDVYDDIKGEQIYDPYIIKVDRCVYFAEYTNALMQPVESMPH